MRTYLFVLLALLLVAGCKSPTTLHTGSAARSFELKVLPDGMPEGGSAARFDYAVREVDNLLAVDVSVSGTNGLKACYFELSYDPASFNPVEAAASGLLAPEGNGLIELAVFDKPGTAVHGQVLKNYGQRTGFSGDGVLGTVLFERRAYAGNQRAVSAPASSTELYLQRVPPTYDAAENQMVFGYAQDGDYDQNGFVNISDLSPLGAHFGAQNEAGGAFDLSDIKSVVDGDANGEINLSDITPIGANFGAQVTGFRIYAAADLYPDYQMPLAEPPAGLQSADFVPFSQLTGSRASERLSFRYTLGSTQHFWIWSQGVTTSGPGELSRPGWVAERKPGYDIYHPDAYQLIWDGSGLRWYYSLWADYDQNSEVNIADLSPIAMLFLHEPPQQPPLLVWATDGYPDGVIEFNDANVVSEFLNQKATGGYAVFATDNQALVPEDPYAAETLDPLATVPFAGSFFKWNMPEREATVRRTFIYQPADPSGMYFWVRPVIPVADGGGYGTRSGVVFVP